MKSSESDVPPPFSPPARAPPPELVRAIQLERDFASDLATRRPLGTYALIGLCILAFGLEQLPGDMIDRAGMNLGEAVQAGQIWRLGSCMFLHANLIHIGGNMWVLYSLGPFLEKIIGTPRFLALYALCGLAGSLCSAFIHPNVASLGASGAIWGLFGAAMALALRPQSLLPPLTAQNMKRRLIQPLLINAGLSLMPGVDGSAHAGGGVAGFVLMITGVIAFGARPQFLGERESSGTKILWLAIGGALSLAMIACLGTAILISQISQH